MSNLTYCPVCGNKLGLREEGGRLRPVCTHCGYVHYRNPVPGVGILIEMEGGVVLIQRKNNPHQGEWTLPSGFIEADESAEEAALRETEEETGLKIEIIELAGINSFPEGPPTSGIMIFFRARPVGGVLQAGDDALDARVFQPETMPRLPFRTHREIMAQWLSKYSQPALQADPAAQLPTDPYLIRPAEAYDSDEVLALLATIPANRQLTEAEWREVRQRFREGMGLEIFVAQSLQHPPIVIGMIALSVMRALTEGRGVINDLAVLPGYQRQGVDAALLEAVLRRAARLNLSHISVNTERSSAYSRAFYAASGFADIIEMGLKIR